MGAQAARIAPVIALQPLRRLFSSHAVLAFSMLLMRALDASSELTDAEGLPFASSTFGRALALVLLLACMLALVFVIRETWLARRSGPAWILAGLLLAALWRTEQVELPDILYALAAFGAMAASRVRTASPQT